MGAQDHCACPVPAVRPPQHHVVLTVSLWPVLEAECEGEGGVVFEELRREGVPPKVVRVLAGLTDKPTVNGAWEGQQVTLRATRGP